MAPSRVVDRRISGDRPATVESLMQRAIDDGPRHWIGRGFSEPLARSANLRVVSYDGETETLVLSFLVTERLCNDFDTLHGGAQATAIDVFTSMLLGVVQPSPSVTTDLHLSCISPAPLGSKVVAVCKTVKHGGKLQYASCDLYREVPSASTSDGGDAATVAQQPPPTTTRRVLVAKGMHTKYVVPKRKKGYAGKTTPPPRSKL